MTKNEKKNKIENENENKKWFTIPVGDKWGSIAGPFALPLSLPFSQLFSLPLHQDIKIQVYNEVEVELAFIDSIFYAVLMCVVVSSYCLIQKRSINNNGIKSWTFWW